MTLSFQTVAREIRSLVSRRRELLTLLGSIFAALGIFLENVLSRKLPESLRVLEGHVFATYAFLLLVPSLLLALRLARLNAGMVLNGILYSRVMLEQEFTHRSDPARAARMNPFGASFLLFLLADLLAAFAMALLLLVLDRPAWLATLGAALVFGAWVALYVLFHWRAVATARARIASATAVAPTQEDWRAHVGGSLDDANHDMTGVIALVGLIVFSAFQSLSGLGAVSAEADLPSDALARHAPAVYGLLMTVTCVMGMTVYLRLRVAAGQFAKALDPEDRPFRPLALTDSLLGYVLLAFLFAVSLHVALFPRLGPVTTVALGAFVAAIAIEQLVILWASRR